jgi:hypothetical protein
MTKSKFCCGDSSLICLSHLSYYERRAIVLNFIYTSLDIAVPIAFGRPISASACPSNQGFVDRHFSVLVLSISLSNILA